MAESPRPLDELAASVVARRGAALAALSPWARQLLAAVGEGVGLRGIGVLAERGRLALTAAERLSISQRLATAQFVERPSLLGALSPELPDRFAERVRQRFLSVAAKYEMKAMGEGEVAAPELPMAESGLPVGPEAAPDFPPEAVSPEAGYPSPAPPGPARPRPSAPQRFGSLQEQIASLRAEAEARAQTGMTSRTAQISSAVHRPPPSAPPAGRPPERPKPGEALTPRRPAPGQKLRRFSRIEELTPGAAEGGPSTEGAPRAVETRLPVSPPRMGPPEAPVPATAALEQPPASPPEAAPPATEEGLPLRALSGETPPSEAAPPAEAERAASISIAPTRVQRQRAEPQEPGAQRVEVDASPVSSTPASPQPDTPIEAAPPSTEASPAAPPETISTEKAVAAQTSAPMPRREAARGSVEPGASDTVPAIEARAPQTPHADLPPAEAAPTPSLSSDEAPETRAAVVSAPADETNRPANAPAEGTPAERTPPSAAAIRPRETALPLRPERASVEFAPEPSSSEQPLPIKAAQSDERPEPPSVETRREVVTSLVTSALPSAPAPAASQIAQPLPLPPPVRRAESSEDDTAPPAPHPLAALNEAVLSRVSAGARLPALRAPSLATQRAPRPRPTPRPALVADQPVEEAPARHTPTTALPETLAADEPETPDRPPRPAPAAPLAALVMRALEPETTGAPPVTALLRSRPPGRTAILPQSLPPDEVEASEAEWRWRSPGAAEDFTPTLPLRAAPREAAPERASTSAETGRPEAARAPLTLAAEPARTPRPMLTATRSGVVQRAEAEGASPPAAADEAPSKRQRERDLDELARQVLPFLKRILAVERERRSGY